MIQKTCRRCCLHRLAEETAARVYEGAQDELAAAARAERTGDGLDGRRVSPHFAAALLLALPHSSPLRRPGPRGQLALLEAA